MKKQSNIVSFFLILSSVFLFLLSTQNAQAQETKKNKLRISAQYVKIMNVESYFDIKVTAKVDKTNITVPGIDISFYNDLEENRIDLGTMTTNHNGAGRFVLKNLNTLQPDSSDTFNILMSFKGNELYSKASKSISFKDVKIKAELIKKDSINYIQASLSSARDSALADTPLKIQLQRLFRPLLIGEEFNNTDENGTIFVKVDNDFPGVDGKLIFEVVLNESDDYGTVKDLVVAPIGIPIIDESTFDQRKMWSARDKTPVFLMIFPNLVIMGIWGFIIYLIINLYRISKTQTNETN
jgi:hypothetical protein